MVQGLGFKVYSLEPKVRRKGELTWLAWMSHLKVQGLGCRIQISGVRVQGLGFRIQAYGVGVQGLGLKAYSPESRVRSKGELTWLTWIA